MEFSQGILEERQNNFARREIWKVKLAAMIEAFEAVIQQIKNSHVNNLKPNGCFSLSASHFGVVFASQRLRFSMISASLSLSQALIVSKINKLLLPKSDK